MNKKATIYDYARLCRTEETCENCPLCVKNNGANLSCDYLLTKNPDKANEIILNWCKEHPVETRQSKIQKIIPKITLDIGKECVDICPNIIDEDFLNNKFCENYNDCSECKRAYWLAEAEK